MQYYVTLNSMNAKTLNCTYWQLKLEMKTVHDQKVKQLHKKTWFVNNIKLKYWQIIMKVLNECDTLMMIMMSATHEHVFAWIKMLKKKMKALKKGGKSLKKGDSKVSRRQFVCLFVHGLSSPL